MNPEERADAEVLVDARGLKCPLPVLKLEKALADGPDKGRIVVLATDPVARIDIPYYCRQRGLDVAIEPVSGGAMRFSVTKT
ncbi:sulfurtransferase TusA family protein [Pelagibacterium mangrovi]|uniref:sulfurtransferase TusA family protein n=1 Tax=Pelagibacterium mangrovi TaxID=3119828 RepID=UPI002FC6AF44